MKIIEQFIAGKQSEDTCEDGIVITEDFVAVVDGSTSKTPRQLHPTMKNGKWAMALLCSMMERLPADSTLESFCEQATDLIRQQYLSLFSHHTLPQGPARQATDGPYPVLPPEERMCASAVVYSRMRRELWMVGDCQCMVDGMLYENGKPAETMIAAKRAALFEEACREHPDMVVDGLLVHDYARDAILPLLIKSMQGENKTYAVIDGYPIYKYGVKCITLPTTPCEIVLATDGYPFLKPTLAESEAALKHQLETDPYNIHSFKATKGLMKGNLSFDDRAYVRMTNDE